LTEIVKGLCVLVLFRFENFAAPEDVVGDDEAAGPEFVENEVVIV